MMKAKTVALILLVVAVVIIVIYIIHMIKVKEAKNNGGRVVVRGTYIITINRKTSIDSSSDSSFDSTCFYLNGIETPKLVLKRGSYYEFQNQTDEPFYFSTDLRGGPGAPGSLAKNKKDFIGVGRWNNLFLDY